MIKIIHTSRVIFLILLVFAAAAPWNVAASASSVARSIDSDALDDVIQAQMQKHGLRGVAVAVTQGDQIVHLKGYGTAGSGRPMTSQTPMYIGSQSKSITGLAVAQLIESGKIDPKAPVTDYIPWFEVADPDAARQITIEHLLHHTSGLSDSGFSTVIPASASNEDALRALSNAEITAPVGTTFQYFNLNYVVLSVVIQNTSGMPYEQYIQENIFDVLQMKQTFTDHELARQKGLSQGYSRLFSFALPIQQPHRAYDISSGYIIPSAEDLAKYTIALNNAGIYDNKRVLSPQGVDRLFAPVEGYGMGWFVSQERIRHGGANEAFRTEVELYPAHQLGIVVLTNQGYMFDHFNSAPQLIAGVRAVVLGQEPPPISSGISVRLIGLAILALVTGLSVFLTLSFLRLRTWRQRMKQLPRRKVAWDIALNFIIPTVILVVIYTQLRGFFGYRFSLANSMIIMLRSLPDIGILMVVAALPDYFQGFIKLRWVLFSGDFS
jgi:CubicO group peptidase (beta-lactamase class C family)